MHVDKSRCLTGCVVQDALGCGVNMAVYDMGACGCVGPAHHRVVFSLHTMPGFAGGACFAGGA